MQTIHCPICLRWFAYDDERQVSCAVSHPRGECCHYGQQEFNVRLHDNKGYSEEQCVRCGWVMGRPPLNCQNDDTPHVFPSQLPDLEPDTPMTPEIEAWVRAQREAPE